jgi:hypothetical protein
MAKTSPTARSMKLLRQEGFVVAPCERWVPHQNIRVDLLGVGDLIACRPGDPGPLLIQVTTDDHLAHRKAKAQAEPRLRAWLGCGGCRFELHGWRKRGDRWHCRRVELRGEDLAEVDLTPRPRPRRRRRGEQQAGLFDLSITPAEPPA